MELPGKDEESRSGLVREVTTKEVLGGLSKWWGHGAVPGDMLGTDAWFGPTVQRLHHSVHTAGFHNTILLYHHRLLAVLHHSVNRHPRQAVQHKPV